MKKIVFLILFFFSLFIVNIVFAQSADYVLINEIHTDGVIGAGGSYDDWVELYNPTNTDVDLNDWSLQKKSELSTSNIYRHDLSGIIKAKGYFLIVRNHDDTNETLKSLADNLMASSISLSDDNSIYLVDDTEDITDAFDINIVDMVGMGDSEIFEGSQSATNPGEEESLERIELGVDTDENSVDFFVQSLPSPQNSISVNLEQDELSATVFLTINPNSIDVADVQADSAIVEFSVNSDASSWLNYGTSSYEISDIIEVIAGNLEQITLNNLECGTDYNFFVQAENSDQTQSDQTTVYTFRTLDCGISIDNIVMTRSGAKAKNEYEEGWEWVFSLTVWNLAETNLRMKFGEWQSLFGSIDSADNLKFSVDAGQNWIDITTNNVYSENYANITVIDNDIQKSGRQVDVLIQMKVPFSTVATDYYSSYGILTE